MKNDNENQNNNLKTMETDNLINNLNLTNNSNNEIKKDDNEQNTKPINDNTTTLKEEPNDDKKYKQLAFWVGLVCVIVVVAEIVLNSLGVNYEIKLAVEIISYILAFLVSIGVLKSSKQNKNMEDVKNDIQSEILSSTNVKEDNNKQKKNKN